MIFCIIIGNVKNCPKIKEVFDLVKKMSASWYDLGRELDILMNYRDSLKQDGGLTDDTRLEKILEKWITSETKPVTWEVIINALESLERIDLVKKIKMYLEKPKPQKRVSSHDEELHVPNAKSKNSNSRLKVIHIHIDLRKMFITLVWNNQQSFYLHNFHIFVLPVLFLCVKFQSTIELQYNHVFTL